MILCKCFPLDWRYISVLLCILFLEVIDWKCIICTQACFLFWQSLVLRVSISVVQKFSLFPFLCSCHFFHCSQNFLVFFCIVSTSWIRCKLRIFPIRTIMWSLIFFIKFIMEGYTFSLVFHSFLSFMGKKHFSRLIAYHLDLHGTCKGQIPNHSLF